MAAHRLPEARFGSAALRAAGLAAIWGREELHAVHSAFSPVLRVLRRCALGERFGNAVSFASLQTRPGKTMCHARSDGTGRPRRFPADVVPRRLDILRPQKAPVTGGTPPAFLVAMRHARKMGGRETAQ